MLPCVHAQAWTLHSHSICYRTASRQTIRPRLIPRTSSPIVVQTILISNLGFAQINTILRLVNRGQIYREEIMALAFPFIIPFLPDMSAAVSAEVLCACLDVGRIASQRGIFFGVWTDQMEIV